MRKLEKIATLDQQASTLRQENEELVQLGMKLREQVYKLQQELQWHVNNGCQLDKRTRDLINEVKFGWAFDEKKRFNASLHCKFNCKSFLQTFRKTPNFLDGVGWWIHRESRAGQSRLHNHHLPSSGRQR